MNAANNKAIFMAAVTFAWAAITANAASVPSSDFLCWTVRDAYNELENVAVAFSYATVSVDGTYLSVYDPATGSDTGMTRVYTQAGGSTSLDEYSVVYSGKFDSSSAAGIMVELWDASRNRVAWQRYTIESARDNIWVRELHWWLRRDSACGVERGSGADRRLAASCGSRRAGPTQKAAHCGAGRNAHDCRHFACGAE